MTHITKQAIYHIVSDCCIDDKEALVATQRIMKLFGIKEAKADEETPVLFGHLNKGFGYKAFKPINVGAEVFLENGRLFFEMEWENKSPVKVRQYFRYETLLPCVDRVPLSEKEELVEPEPPVGEFIIANATGTEQADGRYYHYAEVCALLNKYKEVHAYPF